MNFNNYEMAVAILTGLYRPSILRLKNSWALVPKKASHMLSQIMQALSPKDSFASLKNILPNASKKPIPYLGLFLADFEFLFESYSTGLGFSDPGI